MSKSDFIFTKVTKVQKMTWPKKTFSIVRRGGEKRCRRNVAFLNYNSLHNTKDGGFDHLLQYSHTFTSKSLIRQLHHIRGQSMACFVSLYYAVCFAMLVLPYIIRDHIQHYCRHTGHKESSYLSPDYSRPQNLLQLDQRIIGAEIHDLFMASVLDVAVYLQGSL